MAEVLDKLAKTPISTILVVSGIIFLLLAVGGRLGATIGAERLRSGPAALVGFILLAIGVLLDVGLPTGIGDEHIPPNAWPLKNNNTPAAIRFITKSGNRLIGGRVGGSRNSIEVWASINNGVNWTRTGTVAEGKEYRDVSFLSDGGPVVYSAFVEHWDKHWQITVCISKDGGNHWMFDSIVADNDADLFLGAPALHFSRDGNLQCYYDSAQVAAESGHPGWQWIFMNARPKLAYGKAWTTYMGVASRPQDENTFARDGMPSVVNLNGNDMMLVCEGVDPANRERNVLYAVKSHDNGRTWDYKSRQQIWIPRRNGVQFNAYCPMAIRYGNGPVGVAFCTDDDFTSPSKTNAEPEERRAHVKFIRTLETFETWGDLQTIEAGADHMYAPGLFELASNVILATTDLFGGRQTIRQRGGN